MTDRVELPGEPLGEDEIQIQRRIQASIANSPFDDGVLERRYLATIDALQKENAKLIEELMPLKSVPEVRRGTMHLEGFSEGEKS